MGNKKKSDVSYNPLEMRGLMHVLNYNYKEGMPLRDLQVSVGSAIKQQLQQEIQKLDSETARTVMMFLQEIDSNLSVKYNRQLKKLDEFVFAVDFKEKKLEELLYMKNDLEKSIKYEENLLENKNLKSEHESDIRGDLKYDRKLLNELNELISERKKIR